MGNGPVVALHNHTEFSSFDGIQRLDTMVEKVASDPAWAAFGRRPACAITDHGTLGGAWKFAKAAKKAGVKPILGIEAYLAIGSRTERNTVGSAAGSDASDKGGETTTKRYQHLTMHALNPTGWKNLLKISNEAHDHYWYKPRTDLDFIAAHADGVMVGTGCLGGPVASRLLVGDYDGAKAAAAQMRDIFGPNQMFVEVMSHGLDGTNGTPDEDGLVLPGLTRIARELGLRLVATNDAHFTHESEQEAHDHWLAVGVNRPLDDPTRFRFNGRGYWLRDAEQMNATMARFASHFGDSDPVANTLWVADQVEDDVLAQSRLRLPRFPLDPDRLGLYMHERGEHRARFGSDVEFYLHEMVRRGAIERYGSPLPTEVRDRLAFEMKVIGGAGLWDYFLIVSDMVSWARSQGIMAGPGRGSAAGSAVSYCLRIVDVDPISNGLLFERFLDPYRAGMPDIDSDFDKDGRDRVIGYLMEKYGEDHVARIGTFGTMGVKKAVRDIARLQGHAEVGADLAGQVPTYAGKPANFAKLLDTKIADTAGFRQVAAASPEAQEIISLARPFEGITTSEGIHACGVLVSAEPLDDLVPTRRDQRSKHKTRVTTWEAPDVEELGLLKLDDLGLETLDIVSTSIAMIAETTGETIDTSYGVLPMDGEHDPRARRAWDLITSGKTQGVFQLEGSGMARLCQAIQPSSLEDISAVVALYRPGPLGTGMHTRYAERKHGREPLSYEYLTTDPDEQAAIGSVLDPTQGTIVYQESVMALAGVVAGFGPGRRNKLRKAFSKKDRPAMEALQAQFMAGAVVRTVDDFSESVDTSASEPFAASTAAELWRTFDASAEYLFNKCISSDTELINGKGITWTVEQLYARLHGDLDVAEGTCPFCGRHPSIAGRSDGRCAACKSWVAMFRRPQRGFHLLALDSADGRIRPQRVADVHRNGSKPVLAVSTADGRTVKVTPNHRLMTPSGWVEAQHLAVGSELVVHGGYQAQEWEPDAIRTTVGERQGRPGRAGLPGEANNGFIDGGFMALSDWTRRTEVTAACVTCGATKAQARLERAHLDGDRTNNTDANLAWLCVSHHKEHDYRTHGRRRRWEKGHTAATSAVVSITPAGTEMTYDVEMAPGSDHNFLANGIVSHNSHSAGYGYLAYVTAFLKANWPAHYGAALLSVTDKDEKRLATLGYLRDENLTVLGPDVNLGGVRTGVDPSTSAIRLGMSEVKGVGTLSSAIVDEREAGGPFSSLADLMTRVKVVTAKPSGIESKPVLSDSTRICHDCVALVGTGWQISNAPDDETRAALTEQATLFGGCTCDTPRTEPGEDDEPRSTTRPDGVTIVVKAKRQGGKYSRDYRLSRVEIAPVLDEAGNPVMERQNLSTGLVEGLIEAGACDVFGSPRAGMTAVVRALRDVPDMEVPDVEWGVIERAKRERTRLGMVASGNPLSTLRDDLRSWDVVDGVRRARIVPLHRLSEDYVVTVGVVASWEVRPSRNGMMARFVLEGSHGSLPGVAWDSALTGLNAELGRPVEPGDVLAVSGRVKTAERRRTTAADNTAVDTDTGEAIDAGALVETEMVREISVQRAWAARFTTGETFALPAQPVAYDPQPVALRKPRRRTPAPVDTSPDQDDLFAPTPVRTGPVEATHEPLVGDLDRPGLPEADTEPVDIDEPLDEMSEGPLQVDTGWTNSEDGRLVTTPAEPEAGDGAAANDAAHASPVRTFVYMLDRDDVAQTFSRSWRHFEKTFPGLLTRSQVNQVALWGARSLPNRGFPGETKIERDQRHECPVRFDVPGGQLVFRAYDAAEYGDQGWDRTVAVRYCAGLKEARS